MHKKILFLATTILGLSSVMGAVNDIQSGPFNQTDLHRAACSGNLQESKKLVKAGASLLLEDDQGRKAIHCAAEAGNSGLVFFLMERGSKITTVGRWNDTVLHYAVRNSKCSFEYLDFLVRYGASKKATNYEGRIPFEEFCLYSHDISKQDRGAIEKLLKI